MSNSRFTSHQVMRLFIIASCILFSFSLFAKDKDDGVKLEWKAIPDSGGYLVEIKDSNGRIIREKTSATQIIVDLKPGTYEHRIGVLNRYGRVSIFSSWIPFDVILSRPPVLTSYTKNSYLSQDLPETFELKGKYLTDVTKVSLRDSNGEEVQIIKSIEYKEPDTILVYFDKKKVPEGILSLRLENPRNKITETEAFLLVADTPERLAALQKRSTPKEPFRFDYGAIARSAVLPGWGQIYQEKSKIRSYAFPFLIAAAGAYTYYKGESYLHSVKDYDAARRTNALLGYSVAQTGNVAVYPLAVVNYLQIPGKYSIASSAYHQVELSIGILAFLYALNLADAAFFPGSRQVKIEGTDKTASWSPVIRNERDGGGSSFASSNQQYLRQRVEVGVQFSW
ncbi:hypothetical protein LEP1GSC050_1601 [Leptospira broomii serovar Hurstbridge str. 5399]|uniref:Uncharacterized protein n=1 Tax=Leptospira broomii serovar Hurstbridge str. 5399 TaxID=1049789 RepID=T0GDK8_9LEPT|nr:DUF5683 domain-containing protein [Leptospira broomii]EQA43498.1 hypothetical protein LEP1GSC050_1601 [Leptospira broomii serovar Hurstbridge str. 5399]